MWYLVVLEIGDKMVDLKLQFPEGFFDGETRCGYYISPEMKKVWAVELDLLAKVMEVCQKYDIKYFANSGTLLGAARHNGMIPWDDDIDLMMKRDDYDKFCQVAKIEFQFPYFFQTEETDPGSLRGHVQIRNSLTTGILKGELEADKTFNQGIFLDIFPYDYFPDDDLEEARFRKHLSRLKNRYLRMYALTDGYVSAKTLWKKPIKWIIHEILSLGKVSYITTYNKFLSEIQKYNKKTTKKLASGVFPDENYYLTQEEWNETTWLPFEMLKIPVPAKYKDVLGRQYGNWKKYQKGTSVHGGVIFDTEHSYQEYLKNVKCNSQ